MTASAAILAVALAKFRQSLLPLLAPELPRVQVTCDRSAHEPRHSARAVSARLAIAVVADGNADAEARLLALRLFVTVIVARPVSERLAPVLAFRGLHHRVGDPKRRAEQRDHPAIALVADGAAQVGACGAVLDPRRTARRLLRPLGLEDGRIEPVGTQPAFPADQDFAGGRSLALAVGRGKVDLRPRRRRLGSRCARSGKGDPSRGKVRRSKHRRAIAPEGCNFIPLSAILRRVGCVPRPSLRLGGNMSSNRKLLSLALIVFGAIFCLVYPLAMVWPAGWAWHEGVPASNDYFMMIAGIYATLGIFLILAARDPARNASLIWFTVWSALAGTAVAVGVGVALVCTRFLGSLLFGISPSDPATFAGIAILLMGIALLASYLPARRATQVDPMVALRSE